MVALEAVRASNERIASTLPAGLVAVFVGGTNGVGETTVRQFVKHASAPRVYIIGRSQEAGNRIVEECKALNPSGDFTFMSRDTSLMRNVDEICDKLKQKEKAINVLFITIGTLQRGMSTDEGLHYPAALAVHARNRFISNLLPLIRDATDLRRVVSVFIGGLEGQIKMDDFQGWNMKLMANRDHAASITTLALESHYKAYPEVSFIHNFPGVVRGGIARGVNNPLTTIMSGVLKVFGSLIFMPNEEAGERHVFLATSARYAVGIDDAAPGVPMADGMPLARSTDGETGGGVYSLDAAGESASPAVEECLARLRRAGMVETVITTIETDIEDALGRLRNAQATRS